MIFKKGDPTLAKNYRPIAIISALYKLFSSMLCNRVMVRFIPQQSPEQAAYRKGFNTEEHLLTLTLLLERAREFELKFGLA